MAPAAFRQEVGSIFGLRPVKVPWKQLDGERAVRGPAAIDHGGQQVIEGFRLAPEIGRVEPLGGVAEQSRAVCETAKPFGTATGFGKYRHAFHACGLPAACPTSIAESRSS
ncbi:MULTISPECIES: hypothetical protein [unclassified Mesorhizobium]|uniref:hypothetical protein n=1 Tax=unclassified Mesorhizobium TaxID=325217 RepID=UPI001FE11276|nr:MULTISPECIES: hypothetical protein [unclassified Mesorhizobium]